MDEYSIFPIIAIMGFTASFFLLFSAFSWEEVDGTVRDKYVSSGTQYVLVDYSTGETGDWDVIPTVYEDCEISDKIHRSAEGSVNCS